MTTGHLENRNSHCWADLLFLFSNSLYIFAVYNVYEMSLFSVPLSDFLSWIVKAGRAKGFLFGVLCFDVPFVVGL